MCKKFYIVEKMISHEGYTSVYTLRTDRLFKSEYDAIVYISNNLKENCSDIISDGVTTFVANRKYRITSMKVDT